MVVDVNPVPTTPAGGPAVALVPTRHRTDVSKAGDRVLLRAHTGSLLGSRNRGDRTYRRLVTGSVWAVLLIFAGILLVLIDGASPAIRQFGLGFVLDAGWDPVHMVFGALPFIVGTVIVATCAMVIAGVVGVLTAICVTELLPGWLSEAVAYLIELLAFIPSVVYGLFGLLVLAPMLQTTLQPWLLQHLGPHVAIFNGPPYGVGYMSAVLILAIMLVPLVVALSREALLLVPESQKAAGLALGGTRWDVVARVTVPYARHGIFGAVIFALGRALGETMAVAMTIGGGFHFPKTVMDQGYTLSSVIANEFNEVSSAMYLSALIYCGLILFVITVGVNVLAFLTLRRLRGHHGVRS
jgi:phosphate transport system permease protein